MRFNKIGQTILLALSLTAIIVAMSCAGADATKPSSLKGNVAETNSGTARVEGVTLSANVNLTETSVSAMLPQGRAVTEIVEVKDETTKNVITVESVSRNNSGGIYQINLPADTTGTGTITYRYTDRRATSPITENINLSTTSVYNSSSGNYTHTARLNKANGSFNHVINYLVYRGTSISPTQTDNSSIVTLTFTYSSSASTSYSATVNYTYDKVDKIFATSLAENTDYTIAQDTTGSSANSTTITFNSPTDHAGKTYIVDYSVGSSDSVGMGIVPAPTTASDGTGTQTTTITIPTTTTTSAPIINKVYVY